MGYRHILVSIPLLLVLICSSCQRHQFLPGKYEAIDPSADGASVVLLLNRDGKGSWIVDDDDSPFSWEARGDKIWLHSRAGGVIAGRIDTDNVIDISLPGIGEMRFRRVKE